MKWIKALLVFLAIVLIPIILNNLLLGGATQSLTEMLQSQLSGVVFGIPFIVTCLLFASSLEKSRKVKWMWLVLVFYLIFIVVMTVVAELFSSAGGWGAMVTVFLGGVYLVGLVIANSFLTFLMRYEEQKQIKIIKIIFVVLLVIDILQLLGLFRPGLLE